MPEGLKSTPPGRPLALENGRKFMKMRHLGTPNHANGTIHPSLFMYSTFCNCFFTFFSETCLLGQKYHFCRTVFIFIAPHVHKMGPEGGAHVCFWTTLWGFCEIYKTLKFEICWDRKNTLSAPKWPKIWKTLFRDCFVWKKDNFICIILGMFGLPKTVAKVMFFHDRFLVSFHRKCLHQSIRRRVPEHLFARFCRWRWHARFWCTSLVFC